MSRDREDTGRFSAWIARPQSIIALSALLPSGCGVFIAVYEASLVRGGRERRVGACGPASDSGI